MLQRKMVLLLWLLGQIYANSPMGRTGIPGIDSLPLSDWKVPSPPLSYSKALLWGAVFPGGAQYYGKHNIRGSFLLGIEGVLLFDVLYAKPSLLKQKNSQIRQYMDDAYSLASDGDSLRNGQDLDFYLENIRLQYDNKLLHRDLMKSEIAWALGLHFYGIMDGLEIVKNSRNPDPDSLSANRAFWYALMFPGAGQLYNGKYGKFGMLWMAMGASVASSIFRQQIVDHTENRISLVKKEGDSFDELENLEERLTLFRKRRNQYYWGLALLYLYSIGDAVVDASLSDFDHPSRFALYPGNSPFSLIFSYSF